MISLKFSSSSICICSISVGLIPPPGAIAGSGTLENSSMRRSRYHPPSIMVNAITASWNFGIPGIAIRIASTPPAIMIALGCAPNCLVTSIFRLSSATARVTIIPVAVEIRSAGI